MVNITCRWSRSTTYQVGDKLLNAVVVINGIMVKADHTVCGIIAVKTDSKDSQFYSQPPYERGIRTYVHDNDGYIKDKYVI